MIGAQEWDDRAQPGSWLEPGEEVLWRGAPDMRIRLSSRTAIGTLAVGALLAYGLVFVFVFVKGAPLFFRLFAGLIVALWVWQLVLQPARSRRVRSDSLYAITTKRAVAVRSGGISGSAGLDQQVVVQEEGGRLHGSAIFVRPSETGAPLEDLAGVSSLGRFRRSGRQGDQGRRLVFTHIAPRDSFIQAARFAGFTVTTRPEPTIRQLAVTSLGFSQSAKHERRGQPLPATTKVGLRGWVRTRLLRQSVRIDSALRIDDAVSALAQSLSPIPRFSIAGWSASGSPFRGEANKATVRAIYRSSSRQNSWSWTFNGAVVPQVGGSSLVGTVGPTAGVAAFSGVWVAFASLFLLGGIVGTISQLASGRPVDTLPLVLVPGAMIAFWFGLIEFAGRSAARDWDLMEQHLRHALNSEGS